MTAVERLHSLSDNIVPSPAGGKRMRVLHIHSGNMFGGVEAVLRAYAREAGATPDVEPWFALCFDGQFAQDLRDADVPVSLLGQIRVRSPWSVFLARSKLRDLLGRHSFHCAVTHLPWTHAMFAPTLRAAGVPLLFYLHGPVNGHWTERWAALTRPDRVLCNSRYMQARVDSVFPGEHGTVMRCPQSMRAVTLGAEERAELRRSLGARDDQVVIVQASRIADFKGHRLHVDALARLKDRDDWVAWFVGGPQQPSEEKLLSEIVARVKEDGLEGRVRFLGHSREVPRLLAAADVYCQPNTAPEPFGVVFIEALLSGLPVVATAMGGALEIVTDACGRLVEADAHAVAGALRALIADPGLRKRLGAAGPARGLELCDAPSRMRELADVYRSIGERRRDG